MTGRAKGADTVRAPFKYFGSKGDSAKLYPAPEYPTIIEPFAGSMGYSRLHYRYKCNGIDLDEEVISIWKWLQSAKIEEIWEIPTDLLRGQRIDELPLSAPARAWLSRWQRVGRTTSKENLVSSWGSPLQRLHTAQAKGVPPEKWAEWMNNGMWGESTKIRVILDRYKWKHWKFFHTDYRKIPNGKATWFVDPPYQNLGDPYNRGASGIDYRDLAEWVRSREGQVIVCEQEGADWLPFVTLCGNVNRMRAPVEGRAAKQEMIYHATK